MFAQNGCNPKRVYIPIFVQDGSPHLLEKMGAPNRVHPDCPLARLNMQIVIYKHTAYMLRTYALSSRLELIVLR